MILTTCRVICLNNKNHNAFKAFDLPISLISKEGFEQPIFGANYICGECKPLMNILPGNIKFKIWFMNGGCGTFAPAYLKMVASCRRNKYRGIEQKLMNSVQNGSYRKTAYIDPNDPSVIYLQQPQLAQNIQYNPMGYAPIPQNPPQQPQYQPQQPQYPPQQQMQQPPYNNNQNYMPPNNQNYIPPNNQNYMPPNNQNYMPPNNQNYIPPPSNMNNNINQQGENNYPSLEEIRQDNNNSGAPLPMYPSQGIEGLNNVINQNNNNNNGGRYFGFFGPSLQNNPNYQNPNNNQ